MIENIKAIIAKQNAGRAWVSEHAKGRGAVGFGKVDNAPIISETFEIKGKAIKIKTEEGVKVVVPKARFVVLDDGSTEVIAGGIGAAVSAKDALRMLDPESSTKLKRALKPRNSVK